MDNDPKHKAAVVRRWLEKVGITVADWPPSSPDMNPIENLHKVWKERVNSYRPTTLQELRNYIETVFRDMTASDTRPLVDSMPRRVKALRSAKGGHTKY
jgi:transposase